MLEEGEYADIEGSWYGLWVGRERPYAAVSVCS